jgi:hypothetical protein
MSEQKETVIQIPQNACPIFIRDIDPVTGNFTQCSLVFHKQTLDIYKRLESYSPQNIYICLECKRVLEEVPEEIVTVTEKKYQQYFAIAIAMLLILSWIAMVYFPSLLLTS